MGLGRPHRPRSAPPPPVPPQNVYDLTPQNDYVYWCGVGVYHTGVEVYGIEYAYGGGWAPPAWGRHEGGVHQQLPAPQLTLPPPPTRPQGMIMTCQVYLPQTPGRRRAQ